jgi:hypothetical protein
MGPYCTGFCDGLLEFGIEIFGLKNNPVIRIEKQTAAAHRTGKPRSRLPLTGSRKKEKKMSREKFEHKDELDCEVTVFEGAHTTCDQIEDDSTGAPGAKKDRPRRGKSAAEGLDPR